MALKSPGVVTLNVYETTNQGETIAALQLQGSRSTVTLGKQLHLVAVTARSRTAVILHPGKLYAYDLTFANAADSTEQTLQQAIGSQAQPISYFTHQLPTFSLPPTNLSQLRIVHGSCRKLHGKGRDALTIVDDLIQRSANLADDRPHQLFLTGDQIYGDDVADPLLQALTVTEAALLGWDASPSAPFDSEPGFLPTRDLPPGKRSQFVEQQGGFTAGLHNKADHAKSHLLSFGEYCSIYLFAWSPVLWHILLTAGKGGANGKPTRNWRTELKVLKDIAHTVWKVRRSLANVPTYMIFDDHDISDDWNLNQAWCLRVLGKAVGRQTVQNGLLAYTLFQAWGNTPDQFEDGRSGGALLQQVERWAASQGHDRAAWTTLTRLLGLPAIDPTTGLPQFQPDGADLVLERDRTCLTWNYVVRGTGHDVIVLDTRTWRGYPAADKPTAPPRLLSQTALDRQLRKPLQATSVAANRVVFILAPTNLFSLRLIDQIQHWNLRQHQTYKNDVGDAWNIHKAALAEFLATVFAHRQQAIVLSGDIHYGSTVYLQYSTAANSAQLGELVQLTSSAIKNSEFKTQLIHTKLKSLLPERDRYWIGWNQPPNLQEVSSRPRLTNRSTPDWRYHIHWVTRQPAQSLALSKATGLKPPTRSSWLAQLLGWVRQLWRNRWLQEGNEVVGVNNIGVVSLAEFDQNRQQAIVQELYWYAPWSRDRVVFSRFHASLLSPQTPYRTEANKQLPND